MEEQFRNKLKNHKVDWNKEDILVGIEEALSKKKESPRYIWIILLLLIMIVSGIFLSLNFFNIDGSQAENNSTLLSKKENIKLSQSGNLQSYNFDTSTVINSKIIDNINSALVEKQVLKNKTNNNITSSVAKNNPSNYSNNLITKSQTIKRYDSNQNTVTPSSLENDKPNYNNSISLPVSQNSNLNKVTKASNGFDEKTSHISSSLLEKKETRSLLELSAIPSLSFLVRSEPVSHLDLEVTEPISTNVNTSKKVGFYIEPNISLGLLQRKFSGINEGLSEDIENNEKAILHHAISLDFGLITHKKWFAHLGFEYQEMTELFRKDFVLKSDTTIAEFDRAYFYIQSDMDTIFISEDRPFIENEVRVVKHWNKHRFITIPISVGRQFNIGHTSYSASVGVSYAILHNFKGRTSIGDFLYVDQEFRLKNRIGFHMSLASVYNISANKQLFIKTILRKSPTLAFYEISNKSHMSYSIGVGFRFLL